MKGAVALVALIALAVVPLAAAQNDTSKAGYGGESAVQVTLGAQETLVKGAQATITAEESTLVASQALPMTGVEVGVALAAGLVLVFFGLGMRRLARQRP